jgi:hypothetical protein
MLGGMGEGSFDFYVPIAAMPGTTQIWVQYVAFIPNKHNGSEVNAQLASDSGITTLVGTQTGKTCEQITELDDQGGTGDWWRITEKWEISKAGEALYLRVFANVDGTANMLDSVEIHTRVAFEDKPASIMPGVHLLLLND